MPREVRTWQLTEPSSDEYEICPSCEGWGGHDNTVCYGFGGREDWQECPMCQGIGEVTKAFLEVWNA